MPNIRAAISKYIRPFRANGQLTAAAKQQIAEDRRELPQFDPGPQRIIDEGVQWLCRAQDNSSTADGGVARHYSLITGWSASYPETTGYIVPTFLAHAGAHGKEENLTRAQRMLDWLVSIQLETGAFQGGMVNQTPVVPVTFNTGQILLGLAAGERRFGTYREPMRRAADWLAKTQDPDGCWRRYASPFARPGDKAYDAHVAWGLLEAARLTDDGRHVDAALANLRWAQTRQRENGWFSDCCLSNPDRPLTHTLGYVLRGIVEGYLFSKDKQFLESARNTADHLIGAMSTDGWLPGRLDANWRPATTWACLTGTSQIAHCWLQLYETTGEPKYRDAAKRANSWVRRTVKLTGDPAQCGAVKGSHPIDGDYGRFEYLNWAAKFTIDANMLEVATDARSDPTQRLVRSDQ